jgi:hypothetical protein
MLLVHNPMIILHARAMPAAAGLLNVLAANYANDAN